MTEWSEIALGEIGADTKNAFATGPFGSSIASKFFTDHGIPVIRGSNLSLDVGSRLVLDDLVFVSTEKAGEHARSIVGPGDLVFTCWGTIGQVGLVDESSPLARLLISNKQMKMTPDPRRVDSVFLYYLLSSDSVVHDVKSRSIGAAVPGFNLGQLRELRVRLPDLATQRRISALLNAFDELIAINKRRIELLQDLATALYREWFVRFRYPGGPVDLPSLDGRLPGDWASAELSAIAQVTMGQSPRSEFYNDDGAGLPFHQGVTDYGALIPTHRKFSTSGSRTATAGDVLCSVRAPVGRLNLADRELILGRGLAGVRRVDGRQALLLEQLRSSLGKEDSLGGGAIFAAIGKSELKALSIVEPSEELRAMYEDAAGPILDLRVKLTLANEALSHIRDLVLPRLVTGQLDISDVDLGDLLPEGDA